MKKFGLRRGVNRYLQMIVLGALAVVPAHPSWAEAYPVKPIKLVVPFSPGGDADVVGRIMAEALGAELKQHIIVENISGASGNIGFENVVHAAPDGYTLLLATMAAVSANPTLFKGLKFDPSKDLVPVSVAYEIGHVIVVNPSSKVKSLADLAELAREKPGKLTFSSAGIGSSTHLYGELFDMMEKVDMVHVPYRGNGQALSDVVANHIQVMFPQLAAAVGHVKSGSVRALAVTTNERVAFLPDVPTVAEVGMPELSGSTWAGIMVPRGTSSEIVHRLNEAIVKVMNVPAMKARLEEIGVSTRTSTPEGFSELIAVETQRWKRVIEAANLTVN